MLKSTFTIRNPIDLIFEHFEVLFNDSHMMQHTVELKTNCNTVSVMQCSSEGNYYVATVDQAATYDTDDYQYVGRFELKNVTFRVYLPKNNPYGT